MTSAEHPLKLATVAVVGTIGLLTVIVTQWILPTVTASLSHDVDVLQEKLTDESQKNVTLALEKQDLSAQLELAKKQLTHQADEIRKQKALSAKQMADLKSHVFTLQMSNTFSLGNPYPIDLDDVKIGDPVAKIYQVYKDRKMDAQNTAVSVDTDREPFLKMTFTHSRSKDSVGKVVTIAYSYRRIHRIVDSSLAKIPEDWLEGTLTRTLGSPFIVGPENDCMLWKASRDEVVYYIKGQDWFEVSGFVLMPAGCDVSDEQMKQLK